MKTLKSTKSVIAYLTIPMLLGGCNLLSPIKDLRCTIISNGEISENIYNYTVNTRTGEMYETDKMTGKLLLVNGKTSDIEREHEVRSLIADNEWKMENITTYNNGELRGQFPPFKLNAALNLKTMEMVQETYTYDLGWEKIASARRKCEWVKPKTTEILQEPKT
jgi:hypothetical protein